MEIKLLDPQVSEKYIYYLSLGPEKGTICLVSAAKSKMTPST